jgi:eukaryotic-like serine/threonine-protein kinase
MSMLQDLKPGDPQFIGPYRLRGQLGVGGMGRVFLGVSAEGQLAAVKVIRADLAADPVFRARFRREAAVGRQVSSRFTAPVVGADTDGPAPWLATTYVAGPSLARAVADSGPLPVASVLRLAAGLAEALSAIHAAGVVHRDLKPSNVILAQDGPRVIDFGISQGSEASALTRTGLVLGSPGFMSPEQAEGGEVGPPSDIFSLGAVLAFAATGEGPFGGGSTPALVYRVVYSPASLDAVPIEVRPMIERCLAKDPGQRPTARDLEIETGVFWPAADRLAEPVTRTFIQSPVPADASRTVTLLDLSGVPRPARSQSERRDDGRRRRRFWRPVAIASIATGLLAASAVAGIALAAPAHHSASVQSGQAAPARMASSTTPPSPISGLSGTNPSTAVTPSVSAPATEPASMPAPAGMSPTAGMSPPASASPAPTTPAPSEPASSAPASSAPASSAPASSAPAPASASA